MKTKPYISEREYLRLEMIGEDEPRNAWIWVRRGVIGGAWTLVLFFGALAWFSWMFLWDQIFRRKGRKA